MGDATVSREHRRLDLSGVYRRILVGYDGSDGARDALVLAQLLADMTGGEVVSEKVDGRSAAHGLQQLAEEIDADLIVVGSTSGIRSGRVMTSTTGRRLLHGSPCALAIAPRGLRHSDPALHVIAVGYDGSPEARQALDAAIALGRAADATMRLYAAGDPPAPGQHPEDVRGYYREKLAEAVRATPDELRPANELLRGEPARALVAEAEKGVDLLCVGSRGYGPLLRLMAGSVSRELVDTSPCPLLIVPPLVRTG